MTFDELIDLQPDIKLAELIQLFLLGYDDKVYINLIINGDEYNPLENIRIIDGVLKPYYDCSVEYLYKSDLLTVGILKED